MNYKLTTLLLIISVFAVSCNQKSNKAGNEMKPSRVELTESGGNYQLQVNGKPFFVKGAGCDDGDIALLASHGANSLRTWMDSDVHTPGDIVLKEAQENGLMVMMGIPLGRERHGFDYNDPAAVAEQFEGVKKQILAMKDHPALLGWGLGNELNLRATNMKVWDAVEEIAAYIHEVDGNHPTTTMLAGIGPDEVAYIKENCPHLDFISIQMYGDIVNLQQRINDAGYDGPYLVTEWGATGHWEVPSTEWNAPIENTSTEKAKDFAHRYEVAILSDKAHCLGSYVFLWGQKQERTPTWYGLFTEDNMETEAIDVMTKFWTGNWPENRCPQILKATLDGKTRYDNIKLEPGKEYSAAYTFHDPDGDELSIKIDILRESTDLRDGGDLEDRPDSLDVTIVSSDVRSTTFVSPKEKGAYRIFVYAMDGNNHAATVNIPFYVE